MWLLGIVLCRDGSWTWWCLSHPTQLILWFCDQGHRARHPHGYRNEYRNVRGCSASSQSIQSFPITLLLWKCYSCDSSLLDFHETLGCPLRKGILFYKWTRMMLLWFKSTLIDSCFIEDKWLWFNLPFILMTVNYRKKESEVFAVFHLEMWSPYLVQTWGLRACAETWTK